LTTGDNVRDDRGMTKNSHLLEPIHYRVTCWDSRKGTDIPGTMTSDELSAHIATCPHRHGMMDTRYGDYYVPRSGPTIDLSPPKRRY
jgi:hypothetical protein